MSVDNPVSILVDTGGTQVGTPTNVLYVSGALTTTGTLPVQVMNTPTVTFNGVSQPVSMSNSPFVGISGSVFITSTGSLPVSFPGGVNVTSTGSLAVYVENYLGLPSSLTSGGQTAAPNASQINMFPWTLSLTGTLSASNAQSVPIVSDYRGYQQVLITSTGSIPVSFPAGVNVTSTGSLSVSVANFPATQNVSFNSVPQPVSMSNQPTAYVTQTGSFHVTVDNNVATVPGKSSTATVTTASSIVSSQQLLGVNTNRLGAVFFNDSPSTTYILFGSGSQFTQWSYRLFANAVLEMNSPIYTGIVSAIWATATGVMRITELT